MVFVYHDSLGLMIRDLASVSACSGSFLTGWRWTLEMGSDHTLLAHVSLFYVAIFSLTFESRCRKGIEALSGWAHRRINGMETYRLKSLRSGFVQVYACDERQ